MESNNPQHPAVIILVANEIPKPRCTAGTVPVCKHGGVWCGHWLAGVPISDSDWEHALAQLKAEQSAVGDTQGGASGFREVAG